MKDLKEELRYEIEMLLPCVSCGVNAAEEDGFGYCTCGNEEKVDHIMSLIQQSNLRAVKAELKDLLIENPSEHETHPKYIGSKNVYQIQHRLEELEAQLKELEGSE